MRHRVRSHAAFTLIELLIVITIIALLVGISVVVGTKVIGTGKQRATEQVLRALDASLTAYIAEKGDNPPAFVADPRATATPALKDNLIPVADAVNMTVGSAGTTINSVGLYMLQAKASPSAAAAISTLGSTSKFYRELSPDGTNTNAALQPTLPTITDAWGNPIRYVHPTFKGIITDKNYSGSDPAGAVSVTTILGPVAGTRKFGIASIRRAAQSAAAPGGLLKDADGAMPKGDRPYFYSAGPDGDPSTTDDNVYLTQPTFSAKK
jgi:prepilin-type N-terminal cleavage/methylation domain-containing protein